MSGRLVALAAVITPLSFATIGGAQTMIAGLQHQVVGVRHWMDPAQFVQAFAISRMAPGPSSLLVTLVGLHVAGPAGAAVATLCMMVPTSAMVLALAGLWRRTAGARWQVALEQGLRPVAAGLIVASAWVLVRGMPGGWPTRAILAAATLLVLRTRVPPLVVLGLGSVCALGFRAAGLLD